MECVICLKNNKKFYKLKRCNHSFHKKCIIQWFEKSLSCPICRTRIYQPNSKLNKIKKWENLKKKNTMNS